MSQACPATFKEVFKFYNEYVKLLYCRVQATNVLPLEVLFELNASLDHLSRFWVYDEDEQHVAHKVYSHLKRSCLDIFKLAAKDALNHYSELQDIDLSLVNNGTFENEARLLIRKIRDGMAEARHQEGYTANQENSAILSFEKWEPVYADCELFEKEFYSNPAVDWAKKKTRSINRKTLSVSVLISAIVSFFLKERIMYVFEWVGGLIGALHDHH